MAREIVEKVSDADKAIFKKKIKKLSKYKGNGTELISVYIPPATNRSSVMDQLTEEISQSSNIKDPKTRKNVQGALRKIINFLKRIDFKIPSLGLVVFSGNISEIPGKSNIKLFTLKPVKKLNTKLYWCDSSFHLTPLTKMADPEEIYGILAIDKNEATVAILKGKRYDIVAHFKSNVAGKTRAGGQCLDKNSLVQLHDGNIIEIKNTHNPLNVKSADFKENEIVESAIKHKWDSEKNAIKIITKNPRIELVCSKDHFLFTANNGKINEISAGKLSEGDLLIMPEKLEFKGTEINLTGNYFNSYKTTKKGINILIKKRLKLGLSQKELGKKLKIHQASVSAFERQKFNPKQDYLKKYCNALKINFDEFVKQYCKPASSLKLPNKLTKDFAQFLGFFSGDGSFEKERITLFEEKETNIKKYFKLGKKLFNSNQSLKFRKNKNYWQLRIYGKPIVKIINEEFPEIKKAKNTLIPEKILKSHNTVLAGFLQGLFDAEGFVSRKRLGIRLNNKKMIQQIQMSLLRFGIISSIYEYDNRNNPYSNNHRFSLDISEKESLKNFLKHINFSFIEKQKKLRETAFETQGKSNVRQLIIDGKTIRKMFEKKGLNTENFPNVSDFFRNQKMMNKKVFNDSIIKHIKNKDLKKEFEKIVSIPFLPVKIKEIIKLNKKIKMTDIETGKQNFIANCLIVHNSAKRFEHLRDEALHNFFKSTAEKTNNIFTIDIDKLKGFIIAGPGLTKEEFMEEELLDHRIRKKIIGKIDTSYTDESGIREVMQKAENLLKETDMMKEKEVLQNFFSKLAKDELAAYGEKEILESIKLGKVETLIISEANEKTVYVFKCLQNNETKEVIVSEEDGFEPSSFKWPECNSGIEVIEEIEYIDYLIELCEKTGAKTKVVSTDTEEGMQFFTGFGGIGAILRYK